MPNLLWPGDFRAGDVFSDGQFVDAMVRVEQAWLATLVDLGIAPAEASPVMPLGADGPGDGDRSPWGSRGAYFLDERAGEDAANPVVPLVAQLRERMPEPAASWIHRGLTSQDVLDTALMLCCSEALDRVESAAREQVSSLVTMVSAHRATPMLARTLTQPAIPSTFGARASTWLTGLLDAVDMLATARQMVRAQVGGAAGTLAAVAELAYGRGLADPAAVARRAAGALALHLGLAPAAPWQVTRTPITRIGDALVYCTNAWGHIAGDVLTGSRAEIGELREGQVDGRGGSSTMPGKRNPVLSVLLHRAAIAGPPLGATLHLAAASAIEERADGGWHAEWDTLRTLARRTVAAAAQASELLAGLVVDTAAMARNLAAARPAAEAEQRAMAGLTGAQAADNYHGATDLIIGDVLARAESYLSAPARVCAP